MTKVLITGGAGYLGSWLTHYIVASGYDTTVLDNFRYDQRPLGSLCHFKNLKIVKGDVRDASALALAKDQDIILPLAALVGAPACAQRPTETRETNEYAIANLMASLSPDQKVVFPNTNSGYGVGGKSECTEEDELRPISLYAMSKASAEKYVMARPNSISLRLATVFGASPRMRTDLMLNEFVRSAVYRGNLAIYEPKARRNFIHVQDVARAFLHCIINFDEMKGNIYNCGNSDANLTKEDLAKAIYREFPQFHYSHGPGSDPDKRDYAVSNAKLEKTGWTPKFSLQDGIRELLCYYRMGAKEETNVR